MSDKANPTEPLWLRLADVILNRNGLIGLLLTFLICFHTWREYSFQVQVERIFSSLDKALSKQVELELTRETRIERFVQIFEQAVTNAARLDARRDERMRQLDDRLVRVIERIAKPCEEMTDGDDG